MRYSVDAAAPETGEDSRSLQRARQTGDGAWHYPERKWIGSNFESIENLRREKEDWQNRNYNTSWNFSRRRAAAEILFGREPVYFEAMR